MSESYTTMTAAAVAAADGQPALVLIDVLPPDHFAACHLPGSHNACVHETAFAGKVAEIAPEQQHPVLLYGAGGNSHDAHVAAEKLARLGYGDIRVLEGGLAAWQEAALPVEGEQSTLPAPETVPEVADGRFKVKADASKLLWIGRNPNGPHDGAVAVAGGEIVAEGGKITGSVTVDLKRIENFDLAGNEWQGALLEHLASYDFFFTSRFPEAVFHIDAVDRLPDTAPTEATHEVRGRLALRGVEAPLSFPANLSRVGDGDYAAEAHFDWDRTGWGVIYGSSRFFARLGMHAVFDPISIQLRIVFA